MRRRGPGFVAPLLACLLLAACGGDTSPRDGTAASEPSIDRSEPVGRSTPPQDPSSPPEDPAPDFEVQTFDGGSFALGEQRGTPVVLNFWESW